MTKDIIISIIGLQYCEDDEQTVPVEIISAGEFFQKNDTKYIIYDEISENFSDTTKNRIKIKNNSVEITKKGLTTVTMIFEENKKNHSYYQTPYGSLLIALYTNSINIEESENSINIEINYELEIDSKPIADCNIQIKTVSKKIAEIV